MSETEYHQVSFSGKLLQPGFSVYLWVIVHEKDHYYYVGMTGDNHYPSARSAIHRLSGHFDSSKRSTQNQLLKQLKERKLNLDDLTITLHHWSIPGFDQWDGPLRTFRAKELHGEKEKKYERYKVVQKRVLQLEQYLIRQVKEQKGSYCLNKAIRRKAQLVPEYDLIANELIRRVA